VARRVAMLLNIDAKGWLVKPLPGGSSEGG
jgi:hypothetical protein